MDRSQRKVGRLDLERREGEGRMNRGSGLKGTLRFEFAANICREVMCALVDHC
jgi:hypothetical protein